LSGHQARRASLVLRLNGAARRVHDETERQGAAKPMNNTAQD
jgi:hypothetical protein